MDDEGFLRRWSRRKTEDKLGPASAPLPVPAPPQAEVAPPPVPDGTPVPTASAPPAAPQAAPAADAARLPTMEDVARLSADSDFSAFVARGVDQAVRRSALKKLFSDPHFNVMDRLDIYIDDYNKPSPMPEGMLDALKHANSLFQRVAGEDEGQAGAAVDESAAAASPAPPILNTPESGTR